MNDQNAEQQPGRRKKVRYVKGTTAEKRKGGESSNPEEPRRGSDNSAESILCLGTGRLSDSPSVGVLCVYEVCNYCWI